MTKGVFTLHRVSGPPRTGHSLRLIWRRTLEDPFSLHQARDPVYFGPINGAEAVFPEMATIFCS